MHPVIDALTDLGGVATTRQLFELGVERDELAIVVMYGRVIRVRKGLWALPGLPHDVLVAKRIGGAAGRVACVSALVLHGIVDEVPNAVHVEIAHNASGLRHVLRTAEPIVLHWTRTTIGDGRLVVPPPEAMRQFERCDVAQATSR